MTPITCIIVDDEPLAVKLLESFVAKTPQLQLLASFTDSVEALSFLRDHPVQLAFMDIQMPDMNGMELSHMLPERTKVIFTTAFKEQVYRCRREGRTVVQPSEGDSINTQDDVHPCRW